MQISDHPTVDELRQAIRERGATLACTICGTEEFALEEATILGAGQEQGYGGHRLKRAQLVCRNCSHVMSFEVSMLKAVL